VRNPLLSRGVSTFFAVCLICLFAATATLSSHQNEIHARRYAVLSDWTTHHVLYPLHGTPNRMAIAGRDPRSTFSWLRYGSDAPRWRGRLPRRMNLRGFDRDWSINLGAGGTAANMFPAKFTFDTTAAPSCTNDYIIYPVNAVGNSAQPNLVAFNNLYSGTAGGAGVCNRTPVTNDDGTDATVLWSYNVDAIGGAVTTSPVISWDSSTGPGSVLGTKVAFVESLVGQPAHFHVLAWKAGDGQDTTDADGLQITLKPHQITAGEFVATDPVTGSGTATDLAFGVDSGASDTFSPPFVDYANDYAYVGDDEGNLYRIKDVFCPSYNTDAGCTAGLAPSLDTTWGTAGVVSVGSGCGTLSGAVEDFATGRVFVGCSDGRLYGFSSTGAKLASTNFLGLGDGSPFGGIILPPIVDSSNGFVYAVSGTNDASAVLMQASTSTFTNATRRIVTLGGAPSAGVNLSLPTFNTSYYSSSISSNWAILSCGYDATGSVTLLYDVGFSGARVMNIVTPGTSAQLQLAATVEACSPLTGFANLNFSPPFSPPTDWLFLGLSSGSVSNYDLNSVTGSGFGSGFGAVDTYLVNGGSSAIVVDNDSADAQASSLYFSSLGSQVCGIGGTGYCAIKLTQAGLN
jgi:hypothetical protein